MILLPGTYLLIEPPVHYVVQPRSTLCECVRGSFRGRHRRSLRKQENRAPRQENRIIRVHLQMNKIACYFLVCVLPRNRSNTSGGSRSIFFCEFRNLSQIMSCLPLGPEIRRSSTYMVKMHFSSLNQKDDGCPAMGVPPASVTASSNQFCQCAPDSGCPYKALYNKQHGLLYLPCHSGLHNSFGRHTHVGARPFSKD